MMLLLHDKRFESESDTCDSRAALESAKSFVIISLRACIKYFVICLHFPVAKKFCGYALNISVFKPVWELPVLMGVRRNVSREIKKLSPRNNLKLHFHDLY